MSFHFASEFVLWMGFIWAARKRHHLLCRDDYNDAGASDRGSSFAALPGRVCFGRLSHDNSSVIGNFGGGWFFKGTAVPLVIWSGARSVVCSSV